MVRLDAWTGVTWEARMSVVMLVLCDDAEFSAEEESLHA